MHAFDTFITSQQLSIEKQSARRLKNVLMRLGLILRSVLRGMWDLLFGPPPLTKRTKGHVSSLFIHYVDAGSCSDYEGEILALSNPYYDWERLGFRLTTSPCHADVLLVVGPFTQSMQSAVLAAYEAMPEPRRIVTVGRIAHSQEELEADEIYRDSYAVIPLPEQLFPPTMWIKHNVDDTESQDLTSTNSTGSLFIYLARADPPDPTDLLNGLLKLEEN